MKISPLLMLVIFLLLVPAIPLLACSTEEECRHSFDKAKAPTSKDFRRLEDPTHLDLQRLPNPSVDDFKRLSTWNRMMYIRNSPLAGKDEKIAIEFFSMKGNVNRNKEHFSRFAQSKGVRITLVGEIQSYSADGTIKGKNKDGVEWDINIMVHRKKYKFKVDKNNNFLLEHGMRGEAEWHVLTGSVSQTPRGALLLEEGTIDGHKVRGASKIEFWGSGAISMLLTEFDGLVFKERGDVVFQEGILDIQGGSVSSFKGGQKLNVEGHFQVDPRNYDYIKGHLVIPPYEEVFVNDVKIKSDYEVALSFHSRLPPEEDTISPWEKKENKVIFTPTRFVADGVTLDIGFQGDFLKGFTRGKVGGERSHFGFIIGAGRVAMSYDDVGKKLGITTQGVLSYGSGPQRYALGNQEITRNYAKTLSSIIGIPVQAQHFDSKGNDKGKVMVNGDFSSYASGEKKVVATMDSDFATLEIMRIIAKGDPKEVSALNLRIIDITEQWDRGQQPSDEDVQFVFGVYKSLMVGSRVIHGSTAARTLYHYLEATGEPMEYDKELFTDRPEVRFVMREMIGGIAGRISQGEGGFELTSSGVRDKRGDASETVSLEKVRSSSFGTVLQGVIWTPDKELRYSFGNFFLKAKARRQGDSILIDWAVDDVYDYERNSEKDISIPTGHLATVYRKIKDKLTPSQPKGFAKASIVPVDRAEEQRKDVESPHISLPDRLAAYLADSGIAREFDMRARWQTQCDLRGRDCTILD